VKLRAIERRDVETVSVLLCESFRRAATAHGARPPWPDAAAAAALVNAYLAADPEGGIVADADGAIAGCGFLRRRGEAATIGPIAAAAPGQGTGGRILDELIARADAAGVASLRLFQDGWNADAFALYAGRSFAVVDVVACLERAPRPAPPLGASRGLEVTPASPADVAELAAFDLRLTGLERRDDLGATVKLVARRRGSLVGFVGAAGRSIGPALALDAADLGALIVRLLPELPEGEAPTARLSTAAPTALLVALGLGFRVVSVGTIMVRGLAPPARPTQIFGVFPEIL
jgi:hypothetical protein